MMNIDDYGMNGKMEYKFVACGHDFFYQEHIIEKKGREREREMTTYLIKIPVFTHTSLVTKLF